MLLLFRHILSTHLQNVRACTYTLLLLATVSVRAGKAQVELGLRTAGSSNGVAKVTVTVRNTGDAFLRDIELHALSPENFSDLLARAPLRELVPGHSVQTNVDVQLPPALSEHAVVLPLRLKYTLVDGRLIDSVNSLLIRPTDQDAELDVIALGVTAPRITEGFLELDVTAASLCGETVETVLRIASPLVLDTDNYVRRWSIPPLGDTLTLRIPIPPKAHGSSIPLHLIAQNQESGRPHATFASTHTQIPAQRASRTSESIHSILIFAAVSLLIVGFLAKPLRQAPLSSRHSLLFDLLVVLLITGVVGYFACPPEILHNTTCTGGDTVAHNYIASQLSRNLTRGRIVDWAPGWWCGFPLFQYYFCLPYLVCVALDLVIPFNVAFKLMTVGGALFLPICAYSSGRLARLPRPTPVMLAVLTLPLLLDSGHVMWGVNLYSTLAGMIANSWSFCLMLLALGWVLRDIQNGSARPTGALLIAAVIASHFFTSVALAGMLACLLLLLLCRRKPKKNAAGVIILEGAMGALLMAWWIIPLLAKRDLSESFGTQWQIDLWIQTPMIVRIGLLIAIVGAPLWFLRRSHLGIREREALGLFSGITFLSLLTSLFLFFFGYSYISPIFVNCRLWPFILHGALAICAIGISGAIRQARNPLTAMSGATLLIVLFAADRPSHARSWARTNFKGLESNPLSMHVFEKLVEPLRGSPGRLAYDLHPDNVRLGSSRIFEVVPHLTGKSIIEGGIVNSSPGSLAAYVLQGELSVHTAGAPPRVELQRFAFDKARIHLDFMRAKHAIVRSPDTQAAFRADDRWCEKSRYDRWTLFENVADTGALVRVAQNPPVYILTDDWRREALEWLYRPRSAVQPLILMDQRSSLPAPPCERIPQNTLISRLETFAGVTNGTDTIDAYRSDAITSEHFDGHRLSFTTSAVGRPHVIAINWFPNWQVEGAGEIYRVAPGMMLIYPTQKEVTLCYKRRLSDITGIIVSSVAAILVLFGYLFSRIRGRSFEPDTAT